MDDFRVRVMCCLDLDHTVFDTDPYFHIRVRNIVKQLLGISDAMWERSYAAVRASGYTLEKHVAEMSRRLGRDLPLQTIWKVLEKEFPSLKQYVYRDVVPVLRTLRSRDVVLCLLTWGSEPWQNLKVTKSGIATFFTNRVFTQEEGSKDREVLALSSLAEKIYVVDNNLRELDAVKDRVPDAQTVWIDRPYAGDLTEEERKTPWGMRLIGANKPRARHRHRRITSLTELLTIVDTGHLAGR